MFQTVSSRFPLEASAAALARIIHEYTMFERAVGLWQRLTGRTDAAAHPDSAVAEDDRRVWVRYPADVEAHCAPADGDEVRLSGRIRDVSRGGIKLVVNRAFGAGSLLSVQLPAEEGHPAITVLAFVVYVNTLEADEWALGCNFARQLTDDELRLFGAARTRAKPSDSRTWARYPTNVKARYHSILDEELTPHTARVQNISASGVALLTDQEVKVGTLLSAELQSESETTLLTLLACVVHVTVRPDGQWLLGCDFISELSEEDLGRLRG
jgi:c-di-GMP-binding flagellar brake protein YcgR